MTVDATVPDSRTATEYQVPGASYLLSLRLGIENRPGNLGKVTTLIGDAGAQIGAIDIQQAGPDVIQGLWFPARVSRRAAT